MDLSTWVEHMCETNTGPGEAYTTQAQLTFMYGDKCIIMIPMETTQVIKLRKYTTNISLSAWVKMDVEGSAAIKEVWKSTADTKVDPQMDIRVA
jgi:hypothetical protein